MNLGDLVSEVYKPLRNIFLAGSLVALSGCPDDSKSNPPVPGTATLAVMVSIEESRVEGSGVPPSPPGSIRRNDHDGGRAVLVPEDDDDFDDMEEASQKYTPVPIGSDGRVEFTNVATTDQGVNYRLLIDADDDDLFDDSNIHGCLLVG